MNLERGKVYSVAGVVSFNLILFIFSAQFFFLKNIHHHWILLWVPVVIGFQMVVAETLAAKYFKSLLLTLRNSFLGLLFFSCLVGLARHYTILTCYQHCGFKLAGMLELSSWIFGVASFRYAKGSTATRICLVISLVFMGIGLFVLKLSH